MHGTRLRRGECARSHRPLRPRRRRSDNFATRYLVSDACYFAGKPLVTAAMGTFDGTLTTIRAHERASDGQPNPTYRCLFPEAPPPGTVRPAPRPAFSARWPACSGLLPRSK